MGTKPEVTKPKLWPNHKAETEALTFWKHEAEAGVFGFSKHVAEAEAQVLPSYYNYPFLPWITCHLLKFRQNIQANMICKWKMLSFLGFETTKPIVIFWICEITKPKLNPKLFPNHEAEAETVSFWNHEAEAEAKTLASNASASWSQSWSSFEPMSDFKAANDCWGTPDWYHTQMFGWLWPYVGNFDSVV